MRFRERLAAGLLVFYRGAISPTLHALAPGGCRFQPTCSEYAAIAVAEWGVVRGGWMALGRLARCHPFCKGGYDPVPARNGKGGGNGRSGMDVS